ncbi:hypothetical protein LTR36_006700 [Oleoguttula mirabilis]|uniref:Protein kinase domain-containing protein n=1 Tax=Oleoguttula mirabilis TaxID=1507867 RepID=A0AAV9JBJ7_9PEZI|nr:hypothetical protein LTR36_006700 [Oleoguttula mirabilis]
MPIAPSITGNPTDLGEDLGVIGHGGSSTVRLVRRNIDGGLSAVKEFPPIAADSSRRDALKECIKLEHHIGKLAAGHAGIAETQELINDPSTGTWWIATTYHNRRLAAEVWDLDTADVERIFLEIVEAVGHMHGKGIAYGDVKLENVLFDSAGHVKLVDFGSATYAGCLEARDADATANAFPGDTHTPPYAPPESFESRTYDRQRADAWAIGVLLYVMSVRELPWIRANNGSVAWCRFIGVPENLHSTCAAGGQHPFDDPFGRATCSSLAVPGAGRVSKRLQGMLWEYLERDPSMRLMPALRGFV